MQITVFGANGKVGSLVVERLLQDGHGVTAFTHRESRLEPHRNLHIIQGEVGDSKKVNLAIQKSDAVISALGSWGTVTKDILTVGMEQIIPSMKRHKLKRIISLTGVEAQTSQDSRSYLHRVSHSMLKLLSSKILIDAETHLKLLEKSGLDWTVLRSPIMNDKGAPGNYGLTQQWPAVWATINRQSVADAMVSLLNDSTYIQKAPFIVRSK